MVGLVVVSHSRALAEAVVSLAGGLSEQEIPIAVAGGAGADHRELGTDATDIIAAIRRVDSPDGTLIVVDLGSAVLSAETAIDLLQYDLTGPARVVPAPLVEGVIAAAVQIGLGSSLDAVAAEANRALLPKQSHLKDSLPQTGLPAADRAGCSDANEEEWLVGRFPVNTTYGLHARPAARIAWIAGTYDARGEIRHPGRDSAWVNAASLNRIATLQVLRGEEFEIRFSGPEAAEALDAVVALVAENLGESSYRPVPDEPPPLMGLSRSPDVFQGVPAAPGVAVGKLVPLGLPRAFPDRGADPGPAARSTPPNVADVRRAFRDVRRTITLVSAELRQEASEAFADGRGEAGEIIDAQAVLLSDPELLRLAVTNHARYELEPLEAFWRAAEEISREYRAMDDEYMRGRAIDVLDVAIRLISRLAPEAVEQPEIPEEPSILLVEELLPSLVIDLDPDRIIGVVTLAGSASSHAAIIARGAEIPMVAAVPLPKGWQESMAGRDVILDGDSGTVRISPPHAEMESIRETLYREARRREIARRQAQSPALLRDGFNVPVLANVATLADARRAALNGADGVGLLRTEFLFLGRKVLPDEDEQLAALREMTTPFVDKSVTVRLLDIGGDKDVAALRLPRESNPFLGMRGVRLLLHGEYEELLHTHLRALLRLAADRPIQLMVPMVSLVEEVRSIRSHLVIVRDELLRAGIAHGWPVDLGIMVETPAAAFMAERLARIVDFFSIGTNDLTQYVMAAERGNSALDALDDSLHPAVLAAIRATVKGADSRGVPVSLCGEVGADNDALPVMLGLGVQQLSVNPAAVVSVKERIRMLTWEDCRRRARLAATCDVAGAVRRSASMR